MYTRRSGFISSNAAISRVLRDGRMRDRMGGTTVHACGQRVKRRMHGLVMCYPVNNYHEFFSELNIRQLRSIPQPTFFSKSQQTAVNDIYT